MKNKQLAFIMLCSGIFFGCTGNRENQDNLQAVEAAETGSISSSEESVNIEEYISTEKNQTGLTIASCKFEGDTLVIPEEINGEKVTEIGDYAFTSSPVKKLTLPDSIERIGVGAFEFSQVETINFGSGLKTIGSAAFCNCDNLQELLLPEGVEIIEGPFFDNGKSLKKVSLPSTVLETETMILLPSYCKNVQIIVPKDSFSEKYCQEYNIPYENS